MLKEYKRVRQIKGEAQRRWFSDDFFDLIVWFDESKNIVGFQLCYDILKISRALTWHQDGGYSHNRVDDGENDWEYNFALLMLSVYFIIISTTQNIIFNLINFPAFLVMVGTGVKNRGTNGFGDHHERA